MVWISKRFKRKLIHDGWEKLSPDQEVVNRGTVNSLRNIAGKNGYDCDLYGYSFEVLPEHLVYREYNDSRKRQIDREHEKDIRDIIRYFGLSDAYLKKESGSGVSGFLEDVKAAAQAEAVEKASKRLDEARKSVCNPPAETVE